MKNFLWNLGMFCQIAGISCALPPGLTNLCGGEGKADRCMGIGIAHGLLERQKSIQSLLD